MAKSLRKRLKQVIRGMVRFTVRVALQWSWLLCSRSWKDVPCIGPMMQQKTDNVNVIAQNGVVKNTTVIVTLYSKN